MLTSILWQDVLTKSIRYSCVLFCSIARLMIAVHKWGVQVDEEGGSETDTEQYSSTLWKNGILVVYNDGFFLVESFQDEVCLG